MLSPQQIPKWISLEISTLTPIGYPKRLRTSKWYNVSSNMPHTYSLINRLDTRVITYTIYHGIQNRTLMNAPLNVRTAVIKTKNAGKTACPLNIL